MNIATWNYKNRYALMFLTFTVLFCGIGLQMGNTQEDAMKRAGFQMSIDSQLVLFTAPPVLKEGVWLVPLERFAKQLALKVEYSGEKEIVTLCGGEESERCVLLRFQDGINGVWDIDGITYVRPATVTEPFGFEIYEFSLNRLEVLRTSHLAPEFTLPDLQNTARRLRDFRGKKTFLYVWGSW